MQINIPKDNRNLAKELEEIKIKLEETLSKKNVYLKELIISKKLLI